MDIGTKQNKNTFPESPYVLKAEEINQIVAELQYIITLAEIVLDSTDTTQVYQALQILFANVVYPDQTGNGFKILQTDGTNPFWGSLNPAGECSTAGATEAKTVAITNFVLSNYCRVTVKFTNANTGATPTLNVEGTGAKPIILFNGISNSRFCSVAGDIIDFIYDGTSWICQPTHYEADYSSGTNVLSGSVQQASTDIVLKINWYDQDDATGATINVGATSSPATELWKATINGASNTQTANLTILKGQYYQYTGSGMQSMIAYVKKGVR